MTTRSHPPLPELSKKQLMMKIPIIIYRFVKNKDFTNNGLERLHSLRNNLTNTVQATKQQYSAKIAENFAKNPTGLS